MAFSGKPVVYYAPAVSSPLNPLAAQPQGHHHHHHGRLARRASIPLSPTQRLLRKKAHSAWRCEVLQHAIKEIEAGSAALADLTPDELSRDDDGDDDDDADDPLNVSFSECASSPDGDLGLAGCCSEKEPLLLTRDRRVHIDFSKIVVEAHLRSPAPPLRSARDSTSRWTRRWLLVYVGGCLALVLLPLLQLNAVLR